MRQAVRLVALLTLTGCVRVPPMYGPAPAYVPLPARVGEARVGATVGPDVDGGAGLGASVSAAPAPGALLFVSVRGRCVVGQHGVPFDCLNLDRVYGGGVGVYFGPLCGGRRVEVLGGYETGRAGARGFRSYEEELEGLLTERRSEVEQAFVQVGYTGGRGAYPAPVAGGGPPGVDRFRAYVGWTVNLRATAARFTGIAETVEGEPQPWPTERQALLFEPGGALTFGAPRSLGRWALGLRLAIPVVNPDPVTVAPFRLDVGYSVALDRLF